MYQFSNIVAILACAFIGFRLLYRFMDAHKQIFSYGLQVPKALRRICFWFVILLLTLAVSFGLDWINVAFHLLLEAGRYRNFMIAVAIIVVGLIIDSCVGVILKDFKTPPATEEKTEVPTQPPPPPGPVQYHKVDDFLKHLFEPPDRLA